MKRYIAVAITIAAIIFLSLNQRQVKASVVTEQKVEEIKVYPTPNYYPYNDEDVHWLALNMYHEARGEGDRGMMAVSYVVLNRVQSGIFPQSVKEVITQKNNAGCQFSWYCDGRSDIPEERDVWTHCVLLARVVLDTYSPENYNNDVLFYHAKRVDPVWNNDMIRVASIGNHVYYKE